MGQYFARRLLSSIFVLFVISIFTFVLMRSIPGGPWSNERNIPQRTIDALNETYNLDAPLWKQYVDYVVNISIPRITDTQVQRTVNNQYLINIELPFVENKSFRWMNFGPSYASRSRTVNDIIQTNLPVSVQLGLAALAVAVVIGIPTGIVAALRRNTMADYASMSIAIVGVSLPVIISGPILRYLFGVQLGILPPTGWGTLKHLILPAFALGFANSALLARLTRASLLQVLNEDYIRTARAKGLSERVVIGLHAFKNSLIPVVTILGPLFAALITGSFVTEIIFGIPGLGRYYITSITNRDYPVIMGVTLLFGAFLILANMFVDLLYALIDPRIQYR